MIEDVCARIATPDPRLATDTQTALDEKTKPRRSLGRLEEIACWFASARGEARPPLPRKAIVVMGADHGVAEEGVSAYPPEVTRQMLLNFAAGGAAINVLARHVDARVVVVDMGAREPVGDRGGILARRIGPGTRNFTRGPAMTRDEAVRAVEAGLGIAQDLTREGVTLLGIGEMGIGNSTAASALAAAYLGLPAEAVVGHGTGVDEAGLARKVDAVRRALACNRPEPVDALDVLSKLGGFEIAGLAGVVLGAAAERVPVVIDGFIASAAALAAARICPTATGYLLAGHRSIEPGHRRIFEALGLRPVLDLEMRLGEGTGAALAMGLVEAALRVLHEMATFAAAGVSDSGR